MITLVVVKMSAQQYESPIRGCVWCECVQIKTSTLPGCCRDQRGLEIPSKQMIMIFFSCVSHVKQVSYLALELHCKRSAVF